MESPLDELPINHPVTQENWDELQMKHPIAMWLMDRSDAFLEMIKNCWEGNLGAKPTSRLAAVQLIMDSWAFSGLPEIGKSLMMHAGAVAMPAYKPTSEVLDELQVTYGWDGPADREQQTDKDLDALVRSGAIAGYRYTEFAPEGDQNTCEGLILLFPNGQSLNIDTICSGCLNNTSMMFTKNPA